MERNDFRQKREAWLQTPEGESCLKISEQIARFAEDYKNKFLPNDVLGYSFVVYTPGCEALGKKIETEVAENYHHYEGNAYGFYDNLLALVHISIIPEIDKGGKRVRGVDYVNESLKELSREFEDFTKSESFKHGFDLKIDLENKTYAFSDLNLNADEMKEFWEKGTTLPTSL